MSLYINGKEHIRSIYANNVNIPTAITDAQERSGFPDRTESTISFVDGSRTFTIAPVASSFSFYHVSIKYIKTSSDSIVIPDQEGTHHFYYNSEGNLTQVANPSHTQIEDLIVNHVWVASVYWNATENKGTLFDERHGMNMPSWVHRYLHETVGTSFSFGLALGDFVISDGTDNEDAQFSIAEGEIYDEDFEHQISAIGSTTGLRIYYGGASGKWTYTTQAGFSVLSTGTGRMGYDNVGTLTEVTNNRFALIHVFAWNEAGSNKMISLLGQEEYFNANAARIGAESEISTLFTTGLPTLEMKPIASVIFQTNNSYGNDVKAKVVQTDTGDNYIDWRSNPLNQGVPGVDHTHPQYLLADGTRLLTYPKADDMSDGDMFGEAETADLESSFAGSFGSPLYRKSDGTYGLADATDDTKMPIRALATNSLDGIQLILRKGRISEDDWTWTVGGNIYCSTTGTLTQTAPTGSGEIVQILGYAEDADTIIVEIDPTFVELV